MLVRAAAATLILALVSLVASALLFPNASDGRSDDALTTAEPDAIVRSFEDASPLLVTVDVGALDARARRTGTRVHRAARTSASASVAAADRKPRVARSRPRWVDRVA